MKAGEVSQTAVGCHSTKQDSDPFKMLRSLLCFSSGSNKKEKRSYLTYRIENCSYRDLPIARTAHRLGHCVLSNTISHNWTRNQLWNVSSSSKKSSDFFTLLKGNSINFV